MITTALVQLAVLLPAMTTAAGIAAQRGTPNSELQGHRLHYTVNENGHDSSNEHRGTALLPSQPFIKHVVSGSPGSQSEHGPIRAKVGEQVELQCEMVGMPWPVVYWARQGRPLASPTADHMNPIEFTSNVGRPSLETATTIAKYRLSCVTVTDAGVYECIGDNGAGRVIAHTRLIVQENEEDVEDGDCEAVRDVTPPYIFMSTEIRMEYPGNDAQLNCRAVGHPAPTIAWFDYDEIAVENGANYTILANGDLLVKRINFGHDSPYRQFTCRATNSAGTDLTVVGLLALKPSDK